MQRKRQNFFSLVFVFLITLILFATVSACGRKGDPVLITPDDKIAAEKSFNNDQESESSK